MLWQDIQEIGLYVLGPGVAWELVGVVVLAFARVVVSIANQGVRSLDD